MNDKAEASGKATPRDNPRGPAEGPGTGLGPEQWAQLETEIQAIKDALAAFGGSVEFFGIASDYASILETLSDDLSTLEAIEPNGLLPLDPLPDP